MLHTVDTFASFYDLILIHVETSGSCGETVCRVQLTCSQYDKLHASFIRFLAATRCTTFSVHMSCDSRYKLVNKSKYG